MHESETSGEEQGTCELATRGRRGWFWKGAVAAVCVALLIAGAIRLRGESGRTEFSMKLVPLADMDALTRQSASYQCDTHAPRDRKKYPKLVSSAPLYGLFSANGRDNRPYVIDESRGTGTGYDALYADANGNEDLTDEKPVSLKIASSPTPGSSAVAGLCVFRDITISPPDAVGGVSRAIVLAPRLSIVGPKIKTVVFLPAFVRSGRVRIGGVSYVATLVPHDPMSQRYDDLATEIDLVHGVQWRLLGISITPLGPLEERRLYGMTTYMLYGDWYSLSTTPSGDVLTVRQYKGDLGAFRVSAAGPKVETTVPDGSLKTKEGGRLALPAAEWNPGGKSAKLTSDLMLPVGDYDVDSLSVRVASNAVVLLTPRPRLQGGDRAAYAIKIRKDKPFVLEIPAKAQMVIDGPEGDRIVAPGDRVYVASYLLTDNFEIPGVRYDQGQAIANGTQRALVPADISATITDSSGKVLTTLRGVTASGWTVPADFVPCNGRETLTLTFMWDTKELFGVVKGTKEIVVESTGAEGAT